MLASQYPRLKAPAGRRAKAGIVHLGLGAFFRAHGAIYVAESIDASGGDWGIIGVSLMRPAQRDLLKLQGFAYTALELTPNGNIPKIISIIESVLVASEEPEAVLSAMADPDINIVTLTVTEKGYCHEPSTGSLIQDHPDIVYDLANEMPRSALGYIVRALQKRYQAGIAPFTILSCDNLPDNGKVVGGVVLELANLIDPDLAGWIAEKGAFPSTMVDRIVPATKPEDIEALAKQTGQLDLSPVLHEPFRQWVIEDNFVEGVRPDFAAVGVQMVADVSPFEHMKLRCLNGTHSSLAYLGYLAGHETIFDAVSNSAFAAYCKHLWRMEIIPSIRGPEGGDLQGYADGLFERYSNPAIAHLTWQIAMDGSQKLPQRILGTISENLNAGRKSDGLILAVAAWMRYVGGIDEQGQKIDVKDPMALRLQELSEKANNTRDRVDALLELSEIFPSDLAANPVFRNNITQAYEKLVAHGAQICVRDCAKEYTL